MKHSLTRLAVATLAIAALVYWMGQGGGDWFGRGDGTRLAPLALPGAAEQLPPGAPPSTVGGSSLVAEAARELMALPAFEAKVRMQAHLAGDDLVGTGAFYHFSADGDTRQKLEMKVPIAGRVSSLLEVNDGRFLWVNRDMPDEKSLSRIDRRRVREALVERMTQQPGWSATDSLAQSGLCRLLNSLDAYFDFASPVSTTQNGMPIWVVEGVWKPGRLAEMAPGASAEHLPEHLPQRVVVILSRHDEWPPLPLRVDYQRKGRGGKFATLAALELYAFNMNVGFEPRNFRYNPGEQEVFDRTEQYLTEIQAAP